MKKDKPKDRVTKKRSGQITFGRENYFIFLIGILTLVLGYIFLAQGPADSFWSLTVAPILLVLSYCVIIPLAILYRKKSPQAKAEPSKQS